MPKKTRNKAPASTPKRTKRLLGIGDGITTEGQLRIAISRIISLNKKLEDARCYGDSEHKWAQHYFSMWQKTLNELAKRT